MPVMAAAVALPAWLNDSLRPTRREKNLVPTTPKVIAAKAGAKTEAAIPVRACNSEIAKNRGNSGIAKAPTVTVTAPTMISARLAVVRSTSAPIGVCTTIAAMPPTPITNPIEAWSQWWVSSRYVDRYGPSPSRTSAKKKFAKSSACEIRRGTGSAAPAFNGDPKARRSCRGARRARACAARSSAARCPARSPWSRQPWRRRHGSGCHTSPAAGLPP